MSSHDDNHLDKQEVIARVLDVVKNFPKVDPSKVTPDVHFQKDLRLNSLDTVEIVMALEEEFKGEIPDKEADKIDLCPLAVEYISSRWRRSESSRERKGLDQQLEGCCIIKD